MSNLVGAPHPPTPPPPDPVELFFRVQKNKNFRFLSSDAETAQGNLTTHPHVGVAGADGTIALARRARAGAEFEIVDFQERPRQRYRARYCLETARTRRFVIGSSIYNFGSSCVARRFYNFTVPHFVLGKRVTVSHLSAVTQSILLVICEQKGLYNFTVSHFVRRKRVAVSHLSERIEVLLVICEQNGLPFY